jgi:hypothetical protein
VFLTAGVGTETPALVIVLPLNSTTELPRAFSTQSAGLRVGVGVGEGVGVGVGFAVGVGEGLPVGVTVAVAPPLVLSDEQPHAATTRASITIDTAIRPRAHTRPRPCSRHFSVTVVSSPHFEYDRDEWLRILHATALRK